LAAGLQDSPHKRESRTGDGVRAPRSSAIVTRDNAQIRDHGAQFVRHPFILLTVVSCQTFQCLLQKILNETDHS
jgi:hypothetical protein